MRFVWRKSNKTTEDVDTNSSRSLGAANYLARSLPEVCGDLDLVRLSEACKWLSSFSRDGRPELQVAASQLASTIGRMVELRFLEFYELNLDADAAEETARKEIPHAAVQFLAAYEKTLLTSGSLLHPSMVRSGPPLPEVVLPAPGVVLADLVDLGPADVAGASPDAARQAMERQIKAKLARHYPVGRDWIEPYQFTPMLDALWTGWAGFVTALREYGQFVEQVRAAGGRPMKTFTDQERRTFVSLLRGERVHASQDLTPGCAALAEQTRQWLRAQRPAGYDGSQWAELLTREGFDLRGLAQTVAGLTSRVRNGDQSASRPLGGYEFQIRQTMEAWLDYRLCDVECYIGTSVVLYGVARHVDTIEWIVASPGEVAVRYREYKSYNPDPRLPASDQEQTSFRKQLIDYAQHLGENRRGAAMEYVFEYGVPAWVQPVLTSYAVHFRHGLYTVDLASGGATAQVMPQ